MTNAERLKRQGRIFSHSGECGKLVTNFDRTLTQKLDARHPPDREQAARNRKVERIIKDVRSINL